MLNFTKPITTHDGQPVEIVTIKGRGIMPVKGYIGDRDSIDCWHLNGKYTENANATLRHLDLVNVPETIVRYVNVSPGGASSFYESRFGADRCASPHRTACVRVEYTEGQFDE